MKSYDKQISILDWSIIFSIIVLFIMVYIPQSVWSEEDRNKQERRKRMEIISQAEEFYYELTDEYTQNVDVLFKVVEASMDSLIADSLFYGKDKNIFIDGDKYTVNIEKDFAIRVDTTFSTSEQIRKVVTDTIYTIGELNKETNLIDTIQVTTDILAKKQNKIEFQGIYNTETQQREETFTNYLRRKFHLTNDLENCPISDNNFSKKFIIEISNDKKNPSCKILSPIDENDKEWRYGIFRYNPGKQETIENGVKSWAGK